MVKLVIMSPCDFLFDCNLICGIGWARVLYCAQAYYHFLPGSAQLAPEQPEINFKMKIWNVLIAGLNDQNEKPSAGSGERYDISDKNILLIKGFSREGGREGYNEFQGDEISCNDLGLDKEFTFCAKF